MIPRIWSAVRCYSLPYLLLRSGERVRVEEDAPPLVLAMAALGGAKVRVASAALPREDEAELEALQREMR